MTIIKIDGGGNNYHDTITQSHRSECWVDGYITVPENLLSIVQSCKGYCELVIENGVLTNVIPSDNIPEYKPSSGVIIYPHPEYPSERDRIEILEKSISALIEMINGGDTNV